MLRSRVGIAHLVHRPRDDVRGAGRFGEVDAVSRIDRGAVRAVLESDSRRRILDARELDGWVNLSIPIE